MYVLISDKLNTHRVFAFLQFFLCTTLSFLVLCPANSTHLGLSGLSVLSLILRKTSRSHLIYFLCANIWYLSSGNLSNYSIQLVCSPSLRDCVSLFPIFSVLRTIVSHFYCFFLLFYSSIDWMSQPNSFVEVLTLNMAIFGYVIFKILRH